MTELQFFRNTAGNIKMSQVASDMESHPNGDLFLKKGRVIARVIGNGLLAVSPAAKITIPPYMKRIPAIVGFRPITATP